MVLDLHEFLHYKIDDITWGKSKFAQITRGENTLNFEIPKLKNIQITGLKFKKLVNQKPLVL